MLQKLLTSQFNGVILTVSNDGILLSIIKFPEGDIYKMSKKLAYEQPELTLKHFLFDGDIATISDVTSSCAPNESDNSAIEAPSEDDNWWGDW